MSLRIARTPLCRIAPSGRFAPSRAFSAGLVRAQVARDQSKQHPPPPPPPPPQPESSGGNPLIPIVAIVAAAGAAYYGYTQFGGAATAKPAAAKDYTFDDYKKVYKAIADKLIDEDDYDDGSYGPVLCRLAWHSSGTYDKSAKNGGSGPGTMRFETEVNHPANAGLKKAREFLVSVHEKFPWISTGDLFTLGGVVAIQELGGPTIPWRAGRIDGDENVTTPDGRLPDAAQTQDHIRKVFYRMGFNDQEIVALLGAHALGRCHTDRSGYDGPWTFSPTTFTNDFYKLLVDEKWHIRKWDGPKQYEDDTSKSLMMLPADYALVQDKEFKKWVVKYAADNELFFKDFSSAFSRLLELGVPFKDATPVWEFPTVHA